MRVVSFQLKDVSNIEIAVYLKYFDLFEQCQVYLRYVMLNDVLRWFNLDLVRYISEMLEQEDENERVLSLKKWISEK